MSAPLLEVENLLTRIDSGGRSAQVVDGVSFQVARGETFALLGESGCGKSMTALSILRLLPEAARISGGAVRLEGENLLALPETAMRDVRGGRISMIFQEPMTSLNPVMTVGRQIEEVLVRHLGLRGAAARARAIRLVEEVGIPDAPRRCEEYPFQLSGGMKQRVMIALALAAEPALLIADEPTTALDVTLQAQVLELMRDLQRRSGMGILLITHDLGVVAESAQRVAVMYAGQIVETASCAEFFKTPRHPYSRKLFAAMPGGKQRGQALAAIEGSVPPLAGTLSGCRFAARCDEAVARCFEEAPAWSKVGGEHSVRCHLPEAAPSAASAPPSPARVAESSPVEVLSVVSLQMHFPIHRGLLRREIGRVKAVDGISFSLMGGRTLALVGESGCGKTTAGKAILNLIHPSGGQVVFAGEDMATLSARTLRTRRAHMQIIFQDPYASLNPRLRVREIIEEGMAALGVAHDDNSVAMLLGQVGLPPEVQYRYPHEFSGGQRQRIAIARALAVQPRMIVCDEPTSALDVSVQAQILNLLRRLQNDLGLSYLFITHNLAVVEYLAHDVAVMYLGRIVEQGATEKVFAHPRHPYTQALLSAVPVADPAARREGMRLPGEMPSPLNPPAGCHFHPRCPHVMPVCREQYPEVRSFGEAHRVACHWAV